MVTQTHTTVEFKLTECLSHCAQVYVSEVCKHCCKQQIWIWNSSLNKDHTHSPTKTHFYDLSVSTTCLVYVLLMRLFSSKLWYNTINGHDFLFMFKHNLFHNLNNDKVISEKPTYVEQVWFQDKATVYELKFEFLPYCICKIRWLSFIYLIKGCDNNQHFGNK